MNPEFKLSADDIKIKQENALDLFFSGIRSKATKEPMDRILKKFLIDVCSDVLRGDYKTRAQQFVDMAKEDQLKATNIVLVYVKHLRERAMLDKSDPFYLNPSSIPNKIKPIKKLLEMNALSLPWKRIHSLYPEFENKHGGRGYTREEIKKLLEYSDSVSTDFIILASSSGGLRVGAWHMQTWENVFPVYKINGQIKTELENDEKNAQMVCAGMIVYRGHPEEYISLLSLESWDKLQEYKRIFTKQMGRPPKKSDSLILERYSNPRPLTVAAVISRINKLLEKSGLRIPLTEGKRRHEYPATHGFRRYWTKIMMEAQRKSGTLSALVIKERLLGHQYEITKTDKNYYFTSIQDLVPVYLEAMKDLSIGDEERFRIKLENEKKKSMKLESANNQLKTSLLKIYELEAKIQRMEKYQIKL